MKFRLIFLIVAVFYCYTAQSQTYLLDKQYNKTSSSLDTNLQYFNKFYPYALIDYPFSSLGNIGQAYYSADILQYIKRNTDFIFEKNFRPYLNYAADINYYNVKRPYTRLFHSTSTKDRDEQVLHAAHTQNINQNNNLGVKYNLISVVISEA